MSELSMVTLGDVEGLCLLVAGVAAAVAVFLVAVGQAFGSLDEKVGDR